MPLMPASVWTKSQTQLGGTFLISKLVIFIAEFATPDVRIHFAYRYNLISILRFPQSTLSWQKRAASQRCINLVASLLLMEKKGGRHAH